MNAVKIILLIMALFVFLVSSIVSAEARIALVIGNGDYSFGPLANPPEDARIITDALIQTGFEVIQLKNASQKKMKQAVREFSDKLKTSQETVALFFYAGHGVQHGGENYLVPINAISSITAPEHLRYKIVPLGYILGVVNQSASDLNVVILDSCRNSPFQSFSRDLTRGITRGAYKGAKIYFDPGGRAYYYKKSIDGKIIEGVSTWVFSGSRVCSDLHALGTNADLSEREVCYRFYKLADQEFKLKLVHIKLTSHWEKQPVGKLF